MAATSRARITVGAVAVGTAALVMSTLVPAAQATPGSHGGSGSPPGWVQIPESAYQPADGEVDRGPAPRWTRVQFTLAMATRNQATADRLAQQVSDPTSRLYGKYLSPSSYRAMFAPTAGDSATVTGWLRSAGLSIAYNPANHLTITAMGTVAQADRAFRTSVHLFQTATDPNDPDAPPPTTFVAPATPMWIPRAVDQVTTGLLEGIGTSARLARPTSTSGGPRTGPAARTATPAEVQPAADTPTTSRAAAPPPDGYVNAGPCSTYWAQQTDPGAPRVPWSYARPLPYAPCGYTPQQLQGAYGVSGLHRKGIDGRGVTVAITDAYNAPTIRYDSAKYFSRQGMPGFSYGQFREIAPDSYRFGYHDGVNGDLCGEQGWYGEETLDVQAVHSMAPGANVLYVGAASCADSDLLAALNTIVDGHQADIISNSWGDLGEEVDPVILGVYHSLFVQAALQGIGMFFSAGDSGDEVDTIGARETDYPASDSWVTAVGGTSLGVGSRNQYLFETGWGTGKSTLTDGRWARWDPTPPGNWVYGGGGGTSQVFAQPWYQRGVVPSSISRYFGGAPGRAVPDLAALGDPNTGFLVGETQTFSGKVRYGEYRVGGTSLASPLMAGIEALADQASGRAHGFANPAIYRLYGSAAFHDVVNPAKTMSVIRVDYNNYIDASDGTTTTLRTLNQTQSINVRRGYDDVTGVGSPTGAAYVFGLGH